MVIFALVNNPITVTISVSFGDQVGTSLLLGRDKKDLAIRYSDLTKHNSETHDKTITAETLTKSRISLF